MPIDPRIALGVQAPQIESPMNVMANALKLRAMQNENALFEQQQRQAAMQAEEQNRLRSLLAGGASAEQLMRSGFFEQGAKLGEFGRQQSAEERAQAEEARKAEEAAASRRKAMFGVLSVAKNPETYRTAREIAQGMGLDLTGIPEEFPGVEYINTLEDSLLTPQERAERAAKARTASIQEGQLDVSQRRTALEERQFGLQERKFGLEEQKFELDKRKLETEFELKKGELERATPEFIARVERMKAAAKYEGEQLAKARADLPGAIAKAERAITLIDEMVGKVDDKGRPVTPPHEGFRGAVGAGIGTRFIPGTAASSFQARHDQVTGAAFLEAYETLKGTGQITEIEGAKATAAITRMQLAVSEKEYIEAAREFQAAIRSGVRTRKARAGVSAPATGGTSRVTSSGTSYIVEE